MINTNCEVVGALTTLQVQVFDGPGLDFKVEKKLVKCYRLDDGPIPKGFFDDNAEAVFETKADFN